MSDTRAAALAARRRSRTRISVLISCTESIRYRQGGLRTMRPLFADVSAIPPSHSLPTQKYLHV